MLSLNYFARVQRKRHRFACPRQPNLSRPHNLLADTPDHPRSDRAMDVKLITLDPGHFHAALVQKEMYANVAPRVHVYAPLGADLIAHLNRIAGFNARRDQPTAWELEVHAGPDALPRLLAERPGNVVVLA